MSSLKRLLMVVVLFLLCSFGAMQHASAAWSPFGYPCSSGGGSSTVCSNKSTGDPIAGKGGVIEQTTNLIAIIAGVAAVILIIIGGLRYMTSGGDSSKVESAKNTIINSLIGLAIIIVARTLVVFVISRISKL